MKMNREYRAFFDTPIDNKIQTFTF